ncbi:MAG: ester cyclase [Saprospiraceae bacterium]|nr:ester cyclase [Saprospiraceae bacterium]MCB0573340.1 ester cyclase [Saprospiraceae bacterium]MCB9354759.1 ester cyclase [Lewinellaceae bacterium]
MKHISPVLCLSLASLFFFQCAASRKLGMARQNEETVRLWFEEGWNHHRNEELLERVFAPDWSDGNPLRADQTEGIEGMRQTVRFYNKAFSETQFTITHLFADETHVAIRYDVVAKHIGEAFGLAPTGKRFTSSGIVIYEMSKGKIRRSWQELDLMGIIKQLKQD